MLLGYMIRRGLTWCTVLLMMCVILSCSKKSGDELRVVTTHDSTAVRVALFPSLDALPLMLANDWGILDSLDVKAEFLVFRSQMDAEKALSDGQADVAMTDMFRVGWWQSQKKNVRFAFSTRRNMHIVPNKVLRITNVARLDDRMVAVTRNSLVDYFCDKLVASITKMKGQVLRPQINNVELRAQMLLSNQLDAAIMSDLQMYKASAQGYLPLKVSFTIEEGFAGYGYNTLALAKKGVDMSKLRKAYNIVAMRLIGLDRMPRISEQTCNSLFINNGADTLICPKKDFAVTKDAFAQNVAKAVSWLRAKSIVKDSYSGDTLVIE